MRPSDTNRVFTGLCLSKQYADNYDEVESEKHLIHFGFHRHVVGMWAMFVYKQPPVSIGAAGKLSKTVSSL